MLTERLVDAFALAVELHREQVRKGTSIPYVSHLLAVCAIALENGADEEQAIAALLHDAVEDQGGAVTAKRIRAQFGDRVADIVLGCTDSMGDDKKPWRDRKEAYLAHLARVPAETALVSGSDKVHNARSIVRDLRGVGVALWERFSGGRDGVLWYYGALCDALEQANAPRGLVDELRRLVGEMREISGIGHAVFPDPPGRQPE